MDQRGDGVCANKKNDAAPNCVHDRHYGNGTITAVHRPGEHGKRKKYEPKNRECEDRGPAPDELIPFIGHHLASIPPIRKQWPKAQEPEYSKPAHSTLSQEWVEHCDRGETQHDDDEEEQGFFLGLAHGPLPKKRN